MSIQSTKEKERQLLADIKAKSDDDYEKNITYIAAGTLVLSLTFIEKIVSLNKSYAIWTLITSWVILVLTLLTNLVSHQLSSLFHEKTIEDFDKEDVNIDKNIIRRNRIIRSINWATTFSLITGIIFLILFCSINSIKMANDNKNLHNPNDSNYFEKGRTITAPLSPSSTNTTSNSNNTGQTTTGGQSTNSGQGTNSSDTSKK
jgi:hypothetical protein